MNASAEAKEKGALIADETIVPVGVCAVQLAAAPDRPMGIGSQNQSPAP